MNTDQPIHTPCPVPGTVVLAYTQGSETEEHKSRPCVVLAHVPPRSYLLAPLTTKYDNSGDNYPIDTNETGGHHPSSFAHPAWFFTLERNQLGPIVCSVRDETLADLLMIFSKRIAESIGLTTKDTCK